MRDKVGSRHGAIAAAHGGVTGDGIHPITVANCW